MDFRDFRLTTRRKPWMVDLEESNQARIEAGLPVIKAGEVSCLMCDRKFKSRDIKNARYLLSNII